jgi:3-phenylpropionate/trans-cinnamate dioxygenase ferredoxin reductase component
VTGKLRVVIVGAGHAGCSVAAALRHAGFAGELVLLCGEAHLPYHRPPLSKTLFSPADLQPLHPERFFQERNIDLRLNAIAMRVDRDEHLVECVDGSAVPYDALVLATGAMARPLTVPGAELDGVHALRTLDDARRLEAGRHRGPRLAIVGGGWIGLEVAAASRAAALDVTVLECEDRLLARVASPELSETLTRAHREHGTYVLTGAQVVALEAGAKQGVGAVVLEDGTTVDCDQVLVGIGAMPDDALARAAGLPCSIGVIVDADGRTEDPNIFAIGDVTRRPVQRRSELVRLESIPSAIEQARRAAAAILEQDPPAHEVAWFWSDQFDLKLQIAGLIDEAEHGAIARVEPGPGKLAFFHLHGERLVCVEAINAPAEFMAGKALIGEAGVFDPNLLPGGARSLRPAPPAGVAAAAAEQPVDKAASGADAAPTVTYLQPDGTSTVVEVPLGTTMMEAAVAANVPGIVAECGGGCSCGTCHVYVEEMLDRLPEAQDLEADMLAFVEGVQPNSRLSCQLTSTAELDGLVLKVPEY